MILSMIDFVCWLLAGVGFLWLLLALPKVGRRLLGFLPKKDARLLSAERHLRLADDEIAGLKTIVDQTAHARDVAHAERDLANKAREAMVSRCKKQNEEVAALRREASDGVNWRALAESNAVQLSVRCDDVARLHNNIADIEAVVCNLRRRVEAAEAGRPLDPEKAAAFVASLQSKWDAEGNPLPAAFAKPAPSLGEQLLGSPVENHVATLTLVFQAVKKDGDLKWYELKRDRVDNVISPAQHWLGSNTQWG